MRSLDFEVEDGTPDSTGRDRYVTEILEGLEVAYIVLLLGKAGG